VIGGVITSTLLTLLVIPTVYEILDNFREWALGKFRRRVGHGAQAAASPARSPD
jgi:hydrophobic/amphiphilic exporter-1 (mainly G- bacteria), HAE1 family